MIYTGIGSRETPDEYLDECFALAGDLASNGLTLRSGGAPGADQAFEEGAAVMDGPREIYLPWPGFEAKAREKIRDLDCEFPEPTAEAYVMAKEYHPRWGALSYGGRKLMARNVHQVLGLDLLTPSLFILCWTKNGSGKGGTGQALRIAKDFNVPVYDLGLDQPQEEVIAFIRDCIGGGEYE